MALAPSKQTSTITANVHHPTNRTDAMDEESKTPPLDVEQDATFETMIALEKPPAPFLLSVADQQAVYLAGVSTVTLYDGQIDVRRLRQAIKMAIAAAPQMSARLTSSVLGRFHGAFVGVLSLGGIHLPALDSWRSHISCCYPATGHGVMLKVQPLDAELEAHLIGDSDAHSSGGLDSPWGRISDPAKVDEVATLVSMVGKRADLLDTGAPLATVVLSRGSRLCTLGVSVTHGLVDAPAYYTFLGLIATAYNGAPLSKVPHIDNAMQNVWLPSQALYQPPRSTLRTPQRVLNGLRWGQMIAKILVKPNCQTRVFTVQLSKDKCAAIKAAIAQAPGAAPPRSTNDALVQIFAPDGVQLLTHIVNARGRVPGVPNEILGSTGNATMIATRAVPPGEVFSHRTVRESVDCAFEQPRMSLWPILRERTFGWNSWAKATRLPELDGAELLAHHQVILNLKDPKLAHVFFVNALVSRCDVHGTLAVVVISRSPEHARKLERVLLELDIPFRVTDKDANIVTSSAAKGELYVDKSDEVSHAEATTTPWCASLVCLLCCIKCQTFDRLLQCLLFGPCCYFSGRAGTLADREASFGGTSDIDLLTLQPLVDV